MSFSICLNSVDGQQVSGANNRIIYNFAFDMTPEHKGGYKVTFAFCSLPQALNLVQAQSRDLFVYANLGVFNSYVPRAGFTGTENHQLLGRVNARDTACFSTSTAYTYPTQTAVENVPINSNIDAHTLTKDITAPTKTPFQQTLANQVWGAFYTDNQPVYLKTKPTNNQFMVTLTRNDATSLYTTIGVAYTLIISFEAVNL